MHYLKAAALMVFAVIMGVGVYQIYIVSTFLGLMLTVLVLLILIFLSLANSFR